MLSKIRSALSHKRVLIILAFCLIAAIAGGIYLRRNTQPVQTVSPESELRTAVAREGNMVIYASGSGTLISLAESSFGFNTNGQVAQLNVQIGEVVEAGQVLAELDNTSAALALQKTQRALNESDLPCRHCHCKGCGCDRGIQRGNHPGRPAIPRQPGGADLAGTTGAGRDSPGTGTG